MSAAPYDRPPGRGHRRKAAPGPVLEPRSEEGGIPRFCLVAWEEAFPGLVAGITGAGDGRGDVPADFGLTTAPTTWALCRRLERLTEELGLAAAALARQVHGSRVFTLHHRPASGLLIPGEADGLVTGQAGLLLLVTAADCVPVYLMDSESGVVALLHAGWRGVAGGILESGLEAMREGFGIPPESLRVHLGPSICGDCYEVGDEVMRAVRGEGSGDVSPRHLDLRAELFRRARTMGVRPEHVTRSGHCTACGPDQFHSYRGKGTSTGRMAAYIGWRSPATGEDV